MPESVHMKKPRKHRAYSNIAFSEIARTEVVAADIKARQSCTSTEMPQIRRSATQTRTISSTSRLTSALNVPPRTATRRSPVVSMMTSHRGADQDRIESGLAPKKSRTTGRSRYTCASWGAGCRREDDSGGPGGGVTGRCVPTELEAEGGIDHLE